MKKLLTAMLLLLLGGVGLSQPAAKPNPFLEAIRKREAAVEVADITFTMKEIRPKGSPSVRSDPAHPGSKSDWPLPRDLVLESTNRLIIQGAMSRFEGAQPVWHVEKGEAMPHQEIRVSNAKVSKAFYPAGRGTDKQASGALPNSPLNSALQLYYLRPLGLAYRGLDRRLTPFPAPTFALSSIRHRIGGKECLEYMWQVGRADTMSYFVDPQLDHNIVRIHRTMDGRVETQYDIVYAKNPVCGWVPESWVEHWYTRTGTLRRRTEVRVVSTKLNDPLPEEQFDLVFPPGTHVWRAEDQNYYRVREDGRLRLLSTGGEELPTVIAQREQPWHIRHLWLLIVCGASAVVGVLLVRRWRGSPRRF